MSVEQNEVSTKGRAPPTAGRFQPDTTFSRDTLPGGSIESIRKEPGAEQGSPPPSPEPRVQAPLGSHPPDLGQGTPNPATLCVRTRGEAGLCGSERRGWGGHGPGGALLRQASPPGSPTGAEPRRRQRGHQGLWALARSRKGWRRARRSPRTGESGLAQVRAPADARGGAAPRPSQQQVAASALPPSPRFPLPHTHTRAAHLMPHFTAASARSTRATAVPAPSGTQLPGAAPTTARPRTAHACTRCLYPTRQRLRFRSGHSLPRTLQVPTGSARARRRGGQRNRAGVFLVPGWWLAAAREALGSPIPRCILGLAVFEDHKARLRTWNSRFSDVIT